MLSNFSGSERRARTVVSVTESELCYLTCDCIREAKEEYPELKARLTRFQNVGMSKRRKERVFGAGEGEPGHCSVVCLGS